MLNFQNKIAILTGATGGIGRVIFKRLIEEGARVIACDQEQANWASLGTDSYKKITFNLSNREEVLEAAKDIATDSPDLVILNAGWTRAENLEQTNLGAFDLELEANFTGTAILVQSLLPVLRQRESASIVAISSVNADRYYGNPIYSAAKAALEAWIKAIATEEGIHGIRANLVRPGSVKTFAWDDRIKRSPEIVDRVQSFYPLGRMVEPVEVANAALFLSSPLASGITGVSLPVDAGLSASFLPFIREINQ